MARRFYNNVSSPLALTVAVNTSATTLTTGTNTAWPAVPFTAALERGTVNEEVVLVTAKPTSTTFTVTRGYDGTTGKSHAIGAAVELSVAAIDYDEANAHVNDADGLAGGTGHVNLLNKSLVDAKGDLLVGSAADTIVRQAVGTDGTVLLADSTQSTGVRWAAPDDVISFGREGTLVVTTGKGRHTWPFAVEVLGVTPAANTAPAGASVIIDVNKNGTTIFTTQANRPSIASGANAGAEAVPDAAARSYTAGQYLTVDIDQVGSTTAGSDLTAVIRYKKV